MRQADENRRGKLEAEAAHWLVRLESGDADFDQFERWRDADPAHAAAFVQIEAAWTRLDRLRALRPNGPPDPDFFRADSEVKSRRWLMRAAAVCGLGVVGAGAAAFLLGDRAVAATGVGERRTLRLDDGSLLDVNTDSRVSWRITQRSRRVWLERGETALEIAPDAKARPFVLTAAGRELALERGVFNARLRGEAADIAVLRGGAVLGRQARVSQGQAALVAAHSFDTRALDEEAAEAAGAWRRGEIIFRGETLAQAVAEYNRYLTAKIAIVDPSIADMRLGGRFTTHDPAEFLSSVTRAFPVQAARASDGGVMLWRRT